MGNGVMGRIKWTTTFNKGLVENKNVIGTAVINRVSPNSDILGIDFKTAALTFHTPHFRCQFYFR